VSHAITGGEHDWQQRKTVEGCHCVSTYHYCRVEGCTAEMIRSEDRTGSDLAENVAPPGECVPCILLSDGRQEPRARILINEPLR
jgi:hypothetical protein